MQIDPWQLAAGLAGGLGLFLLGMAMMTDGLKLAAGPALEQILARATRTRRAALGSGVLVTALVQSSSAVTVATIGFVNAGLMPLAGALWVLFGANVGTTMTGWIVALLGLRFKIEALALPLVGLGVLLRLTGAGTRRGALGDAVAGFGLLFLGIALLQQAFTGLAATLTLPQGTGALAVLAQLLVGAVMTMLMQSSSASMAIALTAAQGGLIDAQGAAAVVIGANVGTTVTALLAAIGATPNAKRAASAHVVFNLLTGAVALLLLPWLVGAIALGREALGLAADPAAGLALFHTVFNVLGVLLMWPMAARLATWLQQRFRAQEDDAAGPRHLDDTALAVPALAVEALAREVARIGRSAVEMARLALAGGGAAALSAPAVVVQRLDAAADAFVERMNRQAMGQASAALLAQVLRAQRQYQATAEQALLAAALPAPAWPGVVLAQAHAAFAAACDRLLLLCDPMADAGTQERAAETAARAQAEATMNAAYETLKDALLAAGANAELPLPRMEEALRRISALRRAAQQAAQAPRRPGSAVG